MNNSEQKKNHTFTHLSEEQRIFYEEIASLFNPKEATDKEPTSEAVKEPTLTNRQQQTVKPTFSNQSSLLDPLPPTQRPIVTFFKILFKDERHVLKQMMDIPGSSKSIFLSMIQKYENKVKVEIDNKSMGPPHLPIFISHITLQSKIYGNVVIYSKGVARRKKAAESEAFHKLICLLIQ